MARTKTMRTARLVLRSFKLRDAADLYEYAQDDQVGPNAGWPPHQSEKESRGILRKSLMRTGTWAITLADTGKVIGSIGLHDTAVSRADTSGNALELGYALSRDHWGHGYVPEAAVAVLDYAFRYYFVDAVWCGYYAHNHRSARVCQKLGFTYARDQQSKLAWANDKEVTEKLCVMSRAEFYARFPNGKASSLTKGT